MKAVNKLAATLRQFPEGLVELVVLHPELPEFFWEAIPHAIKQHAEMRFYSPGSEDVYKTYGVPADQGAIVVVRPDGYVGTIAPLSDSGRAEIYLSRCIRGI